MMTTAWTTAVSDVATAGVPVITTYTFATPTTAFKMALGKLCFLYCKDFCIKLLVWNRDWK